MSLSNPRDPANQQPGQLAAKNLFLRLLPPHVRAAWGERLETVQLEADRRLDVVMGGVACVYFPVDAVISITKTTPDGRAALLALVGREGVMGLSTLMGGPVADSVPDVLLGGLALRLDCAVFAKAFHEDPEVCDLTLRYLNATFTQIGQAAYCYRHHSPEGHLATLLLRIQDRTGHATIPMTQDHLGRLAGLRRETISHAAARLQQDGALSYHRGQIHIDDRSAIERRACECYQLVEGACRRVYFGNTSPWSSPS